MVLTVITVIVALVIGVIQILTLALAVAEPKGAFWNGVNNVGNHYDVVGMLLLQWIWILLIIVGGGICGAFVVFGAISIAMYKPWRRYIDRRRQLNMERHAAEDLLPSLA
jgi:high-affinity nickel-transport protein